MTLPDDHPLVKATLSHKRAMSHMRERADQLARERPKGHPANPPDREGESPNAETTRLPADQPPENPAD